MVTPARKSASKPRRSSRSSVSKAASTAKTVRGRSASPTTNRRSRTGSRTQSKSVHRRKATVSKTTKTRRARPKKTQKNASFLTRLGHAIWVALLSVLGVFVLVFLLWKFMLPSVLSERLGNKNILYVSNDIDSLEGKILFAHFVSDDTFPDWFVLDGAEKVSLPNGYGEYSVGAAYSLALIDGQSEENIRSLLSRAFGVPVDGIVAGRSITLDGSNTLAQQLRSEAWEQLLHDPSKAVTLLTLSLTSEYADASQVHSYSDLKNMIGDSTLLLGPEDGECSVAVVNTTDTKNLAGSTAQVLEDNGVYVIREDSMSLDLEVTHIQEGSDISPACQSLLTRIHAFFPETSLTEAQTTETKRFRADIVILLGLDVAEE